MNRIRPCGVFALAAWWFLAFTIVTLTGIGCQPAKEREYPQLSLSTCFAHKWLDEPGGMEYLAQFDEIMGATGTQKMLDLQQTARDLGYNDWYENCLFVRTNGILSSPRFDSLEQWQYDTWVDDIQGAVQLAVYENYRLGCDWFLPDVDGMPIWLWGEDHLLLNYTADCPLGAWDGMVWSKGRWVSIGDTRGKTYMDWVCSGLRDSVALGSQFGDAWNAIQFEDGLVEAAGYDHGQIPDPLRNGIGFPDRETWLTYVRPSYDRFLTEFMVPLQRHYVIRGNNHGLRWLLTAEDPTDYPEMAHDSLKFAAYSAMKLEDFGRWGYYPAGDLAAAMLVYRTVEDVYHPLSDEADTKLLLDRIQGWDVSTVQCMPRMAWSGARTEQWARLCLGMCLMGEAKYALCWFEDPYAIRYFRWHETEYAPPTIPQMFYLLGRAQSAALVLTRSGKTIFLRYFIRKSEVTTVAVNIHDQILEGIPAHDAVWFRGVWPVGEYERITDFGDVGADW